MVAQINVVCANRDCRVAETGRCVEGISELTHCPHYGKEPLPLEDLAQEATQTEKSGVELSAGVTLTTEEATCLLGQRGSRVIAIVGPQDAGKTSLLAGLYDLFQMGSIENVEFAQSLTLHSFERACHDSRRASKRAEPYTERTERGEVRFYHLDVVEGINFPKVAILLGDRAGEEYFETRNDVDVAASFPELKRADTITLLADGAKLLDSALRHDVRSDAILTLQAFVEAGVTMKSQRVALVLTKIDAIRDSEFGQRAEAYFDKILIALRLTFGSHFSQIKGFSVAASPKSGTAKRGEGMAGLLQYWLEPPLRYCPTPIEPLPVVSSRAFGRFKA